MNVMRFLLGLTLALSGQQSSLAEGLSLPSASPIWPQWQARLLMPASVSTRWRGLELSDSNARGAASIGAMLGDYFFERSTLDIGTGQGIVRATSGILFGPRSRLSLRPRDHAAWLDSTSTMPYLGIGYSGSSLKGGWGFSADLGWVGDPNSPAFRSGQALFGVQGNDSGWRDLRLAPMLQFGVSYAF